MSLNNERLLPNKFVKIAQYDFIVDDLLKEAYSKGIYIGELIEDIVRVFLKELMIQDISLYAYILREIMRNIPEHSESTNMVLEIFSDSQHEIAFKISDIGIGIMNSLKKNPIYSKLEDDEKSFLIISLKPGVTKTYKKDVSIPAEWRNSGFGLYMVSSIAQDLGSIEIYTGSVGLKISNEFPSFLKTKKIKGTIVILFIDKRNGREAFKKIKEYSKRGQDYIKSSSVFSHYAVYKTASMASTLIDETSTYKD